MFLNSFTFYLIHGGYVHVVNVHISMHTLTGIQDTDLNPESPSATEKYQCQTRPGIQKDAKSWHKTFEMSRTKLQRRQRAVCVYLCIHTHTYIDIYLCVYIYRCIISLQTFGVEMFTTPVVEEHRVLVIWILASWGKIVQGRLEGLGLSTKTTQVPT